MSRQRFKYFFLILSLMLVSSLPAMARDESLKLELDLSKLSAVASESVEVKLDKTMLQLGAKFLSSEKPDEAAAKALVSDLDGIYVWAFEFDKAGAYSDKEVEQIRKQLGKQWQRLVNVKSKEGEDAEVYAAMKGEQIVGFVVIALEPTEFTVVNIVGPIDLAKLSALEGEFGIPDLHLEQDASPTEAKAGGKGGTEAKASADGKSATAEVKGATAVSPDTKNAGTKAEPTRGTEGKSK